VNLSRDCEICGDKICVKGPTTLLIGGAAAAAAVREKYTDLCLCKPVKYVAIKTKYAP
jgi:hypothetical protein